MYISRYIFISLVPVFIDYVSPVVNGTIYKYTFISRTYMKAKCTYSYYLFGHQNFSKNFVSVSRLKRFLFTYTCFDIGILLYVSDLEALQQYHQTQLGTTIIIHSYCQALTQTQHEQQDKVGTVGPCSLDMVSITLFGLARH